MKKEGITMISLRTLKMKKVFLAKNQIRKVKENLEKDTHESLLRFARATKRTWAEARFVVLD